MRGWLSCIFVLMMALLAGTPLRAAEVIPLSPSPHYIVDESHVLKPGTIAEIDAQLAGFEKETTNQIVVGIYPTMQSDDDIAAYSVRVFKAWRPGAKERNNGVLLLIFTQDRKMWIATGYGLEGALPDATAFSIIENDIKPPFKNDDYDGGVRAGIASIMAATKGEYQGSAQPVVPVVPTMLVVFAVIFFVFIILASKKSGTTYSSGIGTFSSGRRRCSGWSSGSSSGWSSGSSLDSGSSGGGFSGGGGSTGGGGAGGSW